MIEKKKLKFNILDVVIILFVVAVLVGVALRSNLLDSTVAKSSSVGIDFSVKIENVRHYTYEAIEVGETFYDKETGNALGKITDVALVPYSTTVTLSDGTIISREVPDKYNMIISVKGVGKVSDEGYYINGNRLVSPNGSIDISTQKVITNGKFLSANPSND